MEAEDSPCMTLVPETAEYFHRFIRDATRYDYATWRITCCPATPRSCAYVFAVRLNSSDILDDFHLRGRRGGLLSSSPFRLERRGGDEDPETGLPIKSIELEHSRLLVTFN